MTDPKIKIKRSAVAGKIPTTSDLDLGELAINTYDSKVFIVQDQGGVGVGTTVIVVNPWSVGTGTNTYNTYFTVGSVGIGTTNPTSKLTVSGDVNISGTTTSGSFVKSGGTSSEFLKADGSVDSSTYLTTTGSGTNLTGIVTYITAGSGISVDQSTGNVTITATGGGGGGSDITVKDEGTIIGTAATTFNFVGSGVSATYSSGIATITISDGGGSSQWVTTDVGIHTLSNVGIGTTNPTSKLSVVGGGNFTGVVTASSFSGNASSATYALTAGIATYATSAGVSTSVSGGIASVTQLNVSGVATATSFVKSGGTSSEFLKADGSVDTNTYLTSYTETDTLNDVTGRGNSTSNGISIGSLTATSGNFSGIITSSSANIYGGLNVSGITTLAGNVFLGDNTADDITVSGEFISNLIPDATASYDLGSTTQRWRDVWSSGTVTASSFSGSGTNLTGIVTSIVAGTNITISGSTGEVTINSTATGGGGGSSYQFNTGITTSISATLISIGSTVLTLPSTADRRYIIHSINASNIAVGNTDVNVIGAFDIDSTGERSYFAYNIPIPTGLSVELLKQPMVLNPSDKITMRATDYDRDGIGDAVQVYISYEESTNTDYFGVGVGTVSIATTSPTGIYTSSTTGSVIQSIRLANRTDSGGYPVSVTVTVGLTTTYLIDDLIVPKYASVEILDTPKSIPTDATLQVIADQTSTIDVQVSGIKL